MTIARRFFAGCLALSCAACTPDDNGTRPPPGADPTHFAPVAAIADVIAFAGPGSVLESMTMNGVRDDGTIDLNATYPSGASYVASAPASSPPGLPVGGGGFAGPGHRRVAVDVRKPNVGMVERRGDSERTFTDRGMNKREDAPSEGAVVVRALPACTPLQLWQSAKTRGAPAGAVASIVWDGTAYSFSILDTPLSLRFDARCAPL